MEKEIKFDGCRLEFKLEAQTPMVHFQYEQDGATLRGSEVKPALDKFILKMEENNTTLEKLKEDMIFSDFEKRSLDYKISIYPHGKKNVIEVDTFEKEFPIYFGNLGCNDESEKSSGVYSNPKVTILCFNNILQEFISKHIIDFFLSHNFGAMKSKGFGSFLPTCCHYDNNKLNDDNISQICAALKKKTGVNDCYFCKVQDYEMFDLIKDFYYTMKSGQAAKKNTRKATLLAYMQAKEIGNEKVWLKQNGINMSQKKGNTSDVDMKNDNAKYVRSMLGVASYYEFQNDKDADGKPKRIDIENDIIKRFPSPVLFKVVKNVIFVTYSEIDDEIFGRSFTFKDVNKKKEVGKLYTPSKDEFDIRDFLKNYVSAWNADNEKRRFNLYKVKNTSEVKK